MRKLHGLAALILCGSWSWAATVGADPVTDWNEIAQPAIAAGRPGPPGALDSALVQIAVHDAVQALDVYSGASVWKQDAMPRRTLSRPLIVGDYVAVGDGEGYVHLLRRDDGAFAARARADKSAITADLQPFGSGFVAQTRDGDVVAFEVR